MCFFNQRTRTYTSFFLDWSISNWFEKCFIHIRVSRYIHRKNYFLILQPKTIAFFMNNQSSNKDHKYIHKLKDKKIWTETNILSESHFNIAIIIIHQLKHNINSFAFIKIYLILIKNTLFLMHILIEKYMHAIVFCFCTEFIGHFFIFLLPSKLIKTKRKKYYFSFSFTGMLYHIVVESLMLTYGFIICNLS